MNTIDILVQNYFTLVRNPFVTEGMYLFTTLFDFSFTFVFISIMVGILVKIVRNFSYAILFLSSLFSGGILIYFSKIFFDVARPIGGVMEVFGKSFPSGHATIATIFFVMLIFIFDSYLKQPSRIIFNFICVTGIILVSFSRIYLGVHWLSDVVGGVVLGLIVSYISVVFFKRLYKQT